MDRPQFDAFSRRVGRALGRRSLLHAAFLATMVRGAWVLTEREAAGKRKRTKRKKCRSPRVKCGKACLPAGACCTSTDCTQVAGQVCVANACKCPSGQVIDGNTCAEPCNPACGN